MTTRNRAGIKFRFLGSEQLEARQMLSGHSIGARFLEFGSAAQVTNYQSFAASVFAQAAAHNDFFAALGSLSSYSEGTALTATLTDPNGTGAGTATYETSASETELKISVTGATASSTLNVLIGTTVVGTLTTDSTGAGTTVFSTNPQRCRPM
jgi:hypothetical protein